MESLGKLIKQEIKQMMPRPTGFWVSPSMRGIESVEGTWSPSVTDLNANLTEVSPSHVEMIPHRLRLLITGSTRDVALTALQQAKQYHRIAQNVSQSDIDSLGRHVRRR